MHSNIQEKLKALFDAYTENLPAKITALLAHWKRLTEYWDPADLRDFHRDVHSLCGSAGTYGYKRLS